MYVSKIRLHIVDHFLNQRNSLFRVLFDFHETIGQQRPRNLICCDKFLDFFLVVSVGVYCFFSFEGYDFKCLVNFHVTFVVIP